MKVFAFLWTDCIFESAYGTISLHETKRGAFKAMTETANRKWYEDRTSQLQYGSCHRPRHSPLSYEAWKITELDVLK